MWRRTSFRLAILLCGVALMSPLWGNPQSQTSGGMRQPASAVDYRRPRTGALTQDDRLSLIAAALDSKTHRYSGRDCSHLVHAIYEQAGFHYPYAPSSDIYAGMQPFQAVRKPQAGDLVVWRGHVGIVIKPSKHIFFSLLSSGPGIDNYQAPYWRSLGRARFYRYVKRDR
jgi:cell wall-associated NlpC family hydrolase